MQSLDFVILGMPLRTWLLGLVITAVTFLVLILLKRSLLRRLLEKARRISEGAVQCVQGFIDRTHGLFLLIISLYAGSLALDLSARETNFISLVVVLALLVQAGIWGGWLISFWVEGRVRKEETPAPPTGTGMGAIGFLLRLALWALIVLVALDNLGINITALVAGLGIGGIAIALAVQNILGDLLASLSISLDKPFVVGDFIIVDDYMGNVEHIGVKTTRLRSLSGEQLIFPNSGLLNSRIRNYKRMTERRAVFVFGVVYQTPSEKLKRIPGMVREIIEAQEQTRFDRAHFKNYGDFSLNFEVVYYVLVSDYGVYMDLQQTINLELYERFEKENIEFAYPTHTVYMKKEEAEQGAYRSG